VSESNSKAPSDAQVTERVEAEDEWWNEADISLEPPPAQTRALRRAFSVAEVAWADDPQHPDYHHLDASFPDQEFEFTPADLELIIRANRFEPTRDGKRILFGLRGAALVNGDKSSGAALRLRLVRPNHREFRCVIGVYDTDTSMLSGFIGSTVPWYSYVHDFYERAQDPRTNMLPTGCYPYFVGPHGAHQIPGCFRLGKGFGDNQQEQVAVLRTLNDVIYDTNDAFDLSIPHDNLHPSFSNQKFMSRGCQTVRGTYTGKHTGEWAEFRHAAGLQERGDNGRRFDYVLVTGLEAAIASKLRRNSPTPSASDILQRLTRLRHGSQGEIVKALQQKLGLPQTGVFGAKETKALSELQRKHFGGADGVYSPEVDARLNFNLLRAAPIVVASRERQIAPGATRVALVMGVGDYAKAPPLRNPKNDAACLADKLTRLGFAVTLITDETQNTLLQAIEQFNDALASAAVGFVFFAGHGVQIGGDNYLLPKDCEVDGELKLKGSAIPLTFILDGFTRTQKVGIIFLDCCRDNPFAGRSGSRSLRGEYRGLAKVEAPRGTFIAFSTAPGLTASDGVDGALNSPFTGSLLNHIETPDERISDLMLTVRNEVHRMTGEKQWPWEHSSLLQPFAFNQRAENLGTEDAEKTNREREEAHWKLAEKSRNVDLLESFVTLYPYSRNRALADAALSSMRNRRWYKRIAIAAAFFVAVVAVGVWYVNEKAEARRKEAIREIEFKAKEEKMMADREADKRVADERSKAERETRLKLQASQSNFLAEFSWQQTDRESDPGTGLLLALEGLPDPQSSDPNVKERKIVPAARIKLESAMRASSELAVLKGHENWVQAVAVTPDGKHAVTGSNDNTARVWDLATGAELRVYRGHTNAVYGVAVTPDGKHAVTASWDQTARMWDLATGDTVHEFRGHVGFVSAVAVTSDGTKAITASDDTTARVWDLRTGKNTMVLKGHTSLVVGVAITSDGTRAVTASFDRTARVWDLNTGAQLAVLKGHKGIVNAVAVTPDGSRVVTGASDGALRVWDLPEQKEPREFKVQQGPIHSVAIAPDGWQVIITSSDFTTRDHSTRVWGLTKRAGNLEGAELAVLKGHQGAVNAVAVTPDGRLVTASSDRTVRVWKLDTHTVLKGHDETITSMAVTPDGSRIVTGSNDKTARVWDLKAGTELAVFRHEKAVVSVAVSPDSKRLITSAAGEVASGLGYEPPRVWNLDTGSVLHELKGHDDRVTSIAVSPDGKRIVTGSQDRTARVWDMETGAQLAVARARGHQGGVQSVAITPDGKHILSGSVDNSARLWDIEKAGELGILRGHTGFVWGVAVTPDGKKAVTASWDGTARVWDLAERKEIARFRGHERDINVVALTPDGKAITGSDDNTARVWDVATGAELKVLRGHTNWVYGAAVTSDGKRAVTTSLDKTARVWNLETGETILQFLQHTNFVNAVALTPDDSTVVTGSSDNTARIWDIKTGAERHVLKGHAGPVYGVAITPDGSKVLTASGDHTVRLWDLKTGAALQPVLEGHRDGVNSVAVSPDGSLAVTGSVDQSVRIWDLRTGALRTVAQGQDGHTDAITSVAVTPDGKRFVTAGRDRTVRTWDISTAETLDKRDFRPGRGHSNVSQVAVTGDGKYLVVALTNHTARVLDQRTSREISVLKGHDGILTATPVVRNGRLLTGSADKTARLWRLTPGSKTAPVLAVLEGHQGSITSVAITPDGKHIVTGSADRTVRVWDAEPFPRDIGKLIDNAKHMAQRCLTPEQRKRFYLDSTPPGWCETGAKWPYDAASYIVQAYAAVRDKREKDAIRHYRKAFALNPVYGAHPILPEIAKALNLVAWDHFLKGNFAEGLPDAEEAVKLDPKDNNILDTRGQIYLALGRIEDAFTDLDNAIKRGMRAPGTYYGRGLCYQRKGQRDEAVDDYRQSLKLAAFTDYDRDVQAKAAEHLEELTGEKRAIEKR
jgi:WD40 repeat protein